jgi:hypothetical protein
MPDRQTRWGLQMTYQSGNVNGGGRLSSGSLQTTAHGEELVKAIKSVLAVSLRHGLWLRVSN